MESSKHVKRGVETQMLSLMRSQNTVTERQETNRATLFIFKIKAMTIKVSTFFLWVSSLLFFGCMTDKRTDSRGRGHTAMPSQAPQLSASSFFQSNDANEQELRMIDRRF
jgi:hypothetical protein